jgi:hypothetical protein
MPSLTDYVQNALPTWLGGSPVTATEQQQQQQAAAAEIAAVGASPGAQVPAFTLLNPQDALINGKTYSFVFNAPGVSAASFAADVDGQAPDFVGSSSVGQLDGGGLNLVFTYEGDGSDLVQDVASAIVAAALQVNADQVTFVSASTQTQVTVGQQIAPTITAQIAASNANTAKLAADANAAAKASDTANLNQVLGTSTVLLFIVLGAAGFILYKVAGNTKFTVGT